MNVLEAIFMLESFIGLMIMIAGVITNDYKKGIILLIDGSLFYISGALILMGLVS